MKFHREMAQREQEAQGVDPTDAAFAAKRTFGSSALAHDQARDVWIWRWLEVLIQDVRLATRSLRKQPTLTAVTIGTLAIGIGASTAMFSVAYGIALRPLPYPDSDRLIRVYEANTTEAQPKHDVSLAAFHEWRAGAPSIESAALYSRSTTRFLADSDEPVVTMSVSPAFFEVLGVRPILGPGFQAEQNYTRFTADDEAVISYAAWQRFLGGRRDVIGQTLEFSGAGENDIYRLVGVMPETFTFEEPVDLWRPVKLVELPLRSTSRNLRYDKALMRLRPGMALGRARAELE
jgi:putative ABC transport system permease protein